MPNTEDVMRRGKVTRRQIDNWVKKGWAKPSRVAGGRGFGGLSYDWSSQEAQFVERMAALVRAGMYPDAAHKVARGQEGALSKLLAAVGPCLLQGELRYRLRAAGPETAVAGPSRGTGRSGPCTVPPLDACIAEEP